MNMGVSALRFRSVLASKSSDAHTEWMAKHEYRYRLDRCWREGSALAVIALNPSTADECHDDATTRRVTTIAHGLGHGRFVLVNLYALRATDPRRLRQVCDPVGVGNDDAISQAVEESDQVLVAWGAAGCNTLGFAERVERVHDLLGQTPLWAKGVTRHGHPRHPLYNAEPVTRYRPRESTKLDR